jgi:hypothetical protein
MVFPTAGFPPVFPKKRLELKSLKGRTKAEELWHQAPQLLSLLPPLIQLFSSSRFLGKTGGKRRNRGGTVGGRTLSLKKKRKKKSLMGPKNGLERRAWQFYTICDKNQLLKVKTEKVTVILWWIHPTFPDRGTAYNSRSLPETYFLLVIMAADAQA